MPAKTRRYIHRIECPRLMTDAELADRLAAFVEEVRARPPREPAKPAEPRVESLLPWSAQFARAE